MTRTVCTYTSDSVKNKIYESSVIIYYQFSGGLYINTHKGGYKGKVMDCVWVSGREGRAVYL